MTTNNDQGRMYGHPTQDELGALLSTDFEKQWERKFEPLPPMDRYQRAVGLFSKGNSYVAGLFKKPVSEDEAATMARDLYDALARFKTNAILVPVRGLDLPTKEEDPAWYQMTVGELRKFVEM